MVYCDVTPDRVRLQGYVSQPSASARVGRSAWILLGAGLLARLFLVFYFTPRAAWTGDPAYYLKWGKHLAITGTYLQTPTDDKAPGMAGLVALGCHFGESGCKYVPLGLFALCGTAAATGLWWMLLPTLRCKARLPALAALQFGVLELLVFAFRLLPDLPALTLGVLSVCALVAARGSRFLLLGCAGGLALGAALYLRADYVVVAVTLALGWFLLVRERLGNWRAARASVALMATTGIALIPWGVRNLRTAGEFRIFSDHGDRTLWWAFNDGRHLDWVPGGEPWEGAPLAERSHIARAAAERWIRLHPADAAFLMASRVLSHFSPCPPALIGAASSQLPSHWLRLAYRAVSIAIHEFWILLGVTALVLGCKKIPFPLVLLAIFTGTRLVFPGAFMPDGGRYALVLIPFLACCAIWFIGQPSRPPLRNCCKVGLVVSIVVGVIQILFVLRWGWWR